MNFRRRRSPIALLLALVFALGLTFGTAGSATAHTQSAPVQVSAIQLAQLPSVTGSPDSIDRAEPDVCDTPDGKEASSNWLPINRWEDASTSFHTRQSSGFWNKIGNLNIRGTMLGMGMSVGNAMTSVSTGLASFSLNFCVLNQMGGAADKISATIGNVLLETGVIIALVVASIVTVVVRAARGGGSMVSGLGAKMLILGMLAVMLAGAGNSTGGGIDGSTADFRPGKGSPGWIAVKVNSTLSELASVGNYGVLEAGIGADSAKAAGTEETGSARSCTAYRAQLRKAYQDTYGGGSAKVRASIPLMLSSVWESTGLQAWRVAQVGTSPAGENVYCRILENTAGIPASTQLKYLKGTTSISNIDVNLPGTGESQIQLPGLALMPFNGDQEDRSYVGWAACTEAGVAPDKNWSRDGATSADCDSWATDNDFGGELFNWGDGDGDIKKKLSDPADDDKRDFLLALHGSGSNQAMTAVLIYAVSSFCMLLVFGGMSIAVIIAKIAALIMIMGGIAVLVTSLAPSASSEKATQYFKHFLGITLLGFAAQFLFGLLVVIAGILVQLGKATMPGGPYGAMNMLWSGISPLLAVFVMHYLFKLTKAPSPFKMSSGMAWVGAGAAVGGAATSRMDGVQKSLGKGNFRGAAKAAFGGKGGSSAPTKGKTDPAPGGMKPKSSMDDRFKDGVGKTKQAAGAGVQKAGQVIRHPFKSSAQGVKRAGAAFKEKPFATSMKAGKAVLGAGVVISGAAPLAAGIYVGWKGTQAVRRYANGTGKVAASRQNSQELVERQREEQQQETTRRRQAQPEITRNEAASHQVPGRGRGRRRRPGHHR